jgi:hypothetical protein
MSLVVAVSMYKEHCENLREIEGAINLIQLDLRRYIATEQDGNVYKYTKLLSYLITCWTEVRILKLLYEKNAFTSADIESIILAGTLKDKWIMALNFAFAKAYTINRSDDIAAQLDFTAKSYYNEIKSLIINDLLPATEIRNRIAHGQWKYAFTNDLKSISPNLTGELRRENIVTLQLKMNLLKGLGVLIHDLAVSPLTFKRDFDKTYRLIEQNKRNLHKRHFGVYQQKMIAKYRRGLYRRNLAKTQNNPTSTI